MTAAPVTSSRDHLVRALEADLVGPFRRGLPAPDGTSGDFAEELKLPPSRWYLTGFLVPEESADEDEESLEELALGEDRTDEDAGDAPPEPKRKVFLPSSFGLTVYVPPETTSLEAVVCYANYERPDEEPASSALGDKVSRKKPKVSPNWRRIAVEPARVLLDLKSPQLYDGGVPVPESRGLVLVAMREPVKAALGLPDGTVVLSIFLVNRRTPEARGFRDAAYVFQVSLELHLATGFIGRTDTTHIHSREADEAIADLQYRGTSEYGVGHGVGVLVGDPDAHGKVTTVSTTWIPRYEVRRVIARDEPSVVISMERLAEIQSAEEVEECLSALPAKYSEWVAQQRAVQVAQGAHDAERSKTQELLLDRAEQASERIRAGIQLLRDQDDVREAFCLANRAMAMAARKKRPGVEPSWRLFQLAFVLLSLPGLSDPLHPDRERAELIFFPTGGGKTEAYLGVIAVTLLLRRIRGQGAPHRGLGVAVVLRYTLRLLTLDQLSRAAALICALEILRRGDPRRLGPERFAVGLWVGSSATANTMAAVQKLVTSYQAKTGGNPAPLTACPWCGTDLRPSSLSLRTDGKITSKNPEEVHIGCQNDACEFVAAKNPDGIPVVFVDEQVYRELPCFLIGTVDKFAMVPWRGETGKLFGKVTSRKGRQFLSSMDGKETPKGATALPEGNWPPELVVQDELHLISGPLGTMVGLYETALDELCARTVDGKKVRPKVIAATATVRRAAEQIQALFGRDKTQVAVFPPPGIDAMETYFSQVDRESPGRLYLGVAAQGRSMKAILLRVYRALLAAAHHEFLHGASPERTRDAYTTLVGYFNSLRELGGMRRIVEDELITRLEKAETFAPLNHRGPHPWFTNQRIGSDAVELTSREKTERITEAKARLALPSGEKGHVDVLLASNMISVGVDIDRLGLMVVAGQPKTTAEYIQASSRVGRQVDRPGLVVTCLNIHKPRDRSHYERFVHYHNSFYRYVEATSVTPFSGPALDRGLAGAFMSIARFKHPELTPPAGVMHVAKHRKALEEVIPVFGLRAEDQPHLDQDAASKLKLEVENRAKNLLDAWQTVVRSTDEEPVKRRYSRFDKDKPGGAPLLYQPLDVNPPPRNSPDGKFSAPTSMRDVEPTAHLWVTTIVGHFDAKDSGDA
ncbi:MAG: hypothetical protein B6A08_03265 [Sorangiineae bacterium NIC37A_2]|jgi:hypothetical protein|nr:MAG: hypothetical protein B6A08_03265 [Sorangiineae bacterium NIC37A_2]